MVSRLHLWLLVAVALSGAPLRERRAAADEPCRPAVRLSGLPDVVAPVEALLRARRLPLASASRCGVVEATVAAGEPAGLRLTITDPDGRTVERSAADAEAAATAIESWARGDLLVPLLGARPAPADGTTGSTASTAPPVIGRASAAASPAAAPWRAELGAAIETGLSGDGALWSAVRVQGCLRIGWLCAGALARYGVDDERSGDSAAFDSRRAGVDAFAIAEVPLRQGRFAWSPGAGIGQSSLHAARDEDREDVVAWRLRGQVAGLLLLGRGWSLRLDLAAEYAPAANVRLGDEADDSGAEMPLAGSPRWLGWLGLGVTCGVP